MSSAPEVVRQVRPTALIGVSGIPGRFDREVLETIAAMHPHPLTRRFDSYLIDE